MLNVNNNMKNTNDFLTAPCIPKIFAKNLSNFDVLPK